VWAAGMRPSARWLRKHGLGEDAAAFMDAEPQNSPRWKSRSPFTSAGGWRYLLRSLLRRYM
jgi:hypothetical protein